MMFSLLSELIYKYVTITLPLRKFRLTTYYMRKLPFEFVEQSPTPLSKKCIFIVRVSLIPVIPRFIPNFYGIEA